MDSLPMMRHLTLLRLCALFAVVGILVVGCTLESVEPPATFTPIRPLPTFSTRGAPSVPTPITTPQPTIIANATPISALPQVVTPGQPIPTVVVVPNPEFEQRSEDIITALLNRLIIPVFNFLFTLVVSTTVSLWEAAGFRGGFTAQVLCCLVPGFIGMLWFLRYLFRRTGRRFLF
jgi:hypothetical protein